MEYAEIMWIVSGHISKSTRKGWVLERQEGDWLWVTYGHGLILHERVAWRLACRLADMDGVRWRIRHIGGTGLQRMRKTPRAEVV